MENAVDTLTMKTIAKSIQEMHLDIDSADSWSQDYFFCQLHNGDRWLKLNFNHKNCNGMDAVSLFLDNYENLRLHDWSERFVISDDLEVELIQSNALKLHIEDMYIGPNNLNVKSISHDILSSHRYVTFIPSRRVN